MFNIAENHTEQIGTAQNCSELPKSWSPANLFANWLRWVAESVRLVAVYLTVDVRGILPRRLAWYDIPSRRISSFGVFRGFLTILLSSASVLLSEGLESTCCFLSLSVTAVSGDC